MNATEILEKLHIPSNQTVHHAIAKVGELIDCTGHPLSKANSIIKEFGGDQTDNIVRARLLAKALVEQAFYARDKFDTINVINAVRKVEQVSIKMPYIYCTSEIVKKAEKPKTITTKNNVVRASKSNNDKKSRALEIFSSLEPTLSAAEKSKIIAEKLEITFANAYYYVTRVFK